MPSQTPKSKDIEKSPQSGGDLVERDEQGRFIEGHTRLGGDRAGTKNFSTMLDIVISKVAKQEGIDLEEAEIKLIIKAYEEAKKGNFNYYKDIMDRRYGKAPDKIKLDANILNLNQLLDDLNEGKFPEIEG